MATSFLGNDITTVECRSDVSHTNIQHIEPIAKNTLNTRRLYTGCSQIWHFLRLFSVRFFHCKPPLTNPRDHLSHGRLKTTQDPIKTLKNIYSATTHKLMYSVFTCKLQTSRREGASISNYIISHILFINMVKDCRWTHLIVQWLKIFLSIQRRCGLEKRLYRNRHQCYDVNISQACLMNMSKTRENTVTLDTCNARM